jgi:PhnB protein
MPKPNLSEQLDRAIQALLTPGSAARRRDGAKPNAQIAPLTRVANELRGLPREDFKAILRAQLEGRNLMASKPAPAPEVRQSATAHLILKDSARAIEFYKQAFGATEIMRMEGPGGKIGHAEIRIGNTFIMLADESPEYNTLSAESLGGSPVRFHISVDDVDAAAARAIAAGARVIRPVQDQFYGERSGQFADPFGYSWSLSMHKEDVTAEELQRRFDNLQRPAAEQSAAEQKWTLPVPYIRKGFHTLTPYLITTNAAKVIDFLKAGLGAEELFRVSPPPGNKIMHAEMRMGDSLLELSDGTDEFPPRVVWNILRVDDVEATYERAIRAGGTSIYPPGEKPWGDRDAGIKDPSGNQWYITARRALGHVTPDTRSIVPGITARGAAQFIDFARQAFGAEEAFAHRSPTGTVLHARIRIGDSIIALGEPHGEYGPMSSHLHMYVPDTDAVYQSALRAGAQSVRPPRDEPYGDRAATVADPFGNLWSVATHIKDVKF